MALALGRSVDELERTLSAREWFEWQVFYGLDPWGDQRQDIRHARLCSIIGAIAGGKTSAEKFMLFPDREAKEQTADDVFAVMKRAARALDAKQHGRIIKRQIDG